MENEAVAGFERIEPAAVNRHGGADEASVSDNASDSASGTR